MGLAEKMFSRSSKTCAIRSDCKNESDKRYFKELFDSEWEVFVIRRNDRTGNLEWFTRCCESATTRYERPDILSATCR